MLMLPMSQNSTGEIQLHGVNPETIEGTTILWFCYVTLLFNSMHKSLGLFHNGIKNRNLLVTFLAFVTLLIIALVEDHAVEEGDILMPVRLSWETKHSINKPSRWMQERTTWGLYWGYCIAMDSTCNICVAVWSCRRKRMLTAWPSGQMSQYRTRSVIVWVSCLWIWPSPNSDSSDEGQQPQRSFFFALQLTERQTSWLPSRWYQTTLAYASKNAPMSWTTWRY